jgi:tetratricopeptide (TPR) repeat protein
MLSTKTPTPRTSWCARAEFLVNRKKYNEALDLLDKAYLFDSHEIDIYLLRSDIYIETNQPEKAEENFI